MRDAVTVIALHGSGFEIHVLVSSLDALEPTIADLVQRGCRPARAGDSWSRTPEGLPICPKHHVPMRQRDKQGDTWYSHAVVQPQTGEELYCRGYAGPNSPGWGVPA